MYAHTDCNNPTTMGDPNTKIPLRRTSQSKLAAGSGDCSVNRRGVFDVRVECYGMSCLRYMCV